MNSLTNVQVVIALPQVPPLVHLANYVAAAVLPGKEVESAIVERRAGHAPCSS